MRDPAGDPLGSERSRDAEQGDDDAPFTFAEHYARRSDRPLRELPSLVRSSLRMVRTAAPKELRAEIALSALQAALTAVQLVLTRELLSVLVDIDDGRPLRDIAAPLALFVAAYTVTAVCALQQGELRRLAGELVARHAQDQVAAAAARAALLDFERPRFHDRLQRAMANASSRPMMMTQATITIIASLLTAGGVTAAIAVVQPVLVPLLLIAFVPLFLVSRVVSRLTFAFDVENAEHDRRRSYLLWLLTDKAPAKELRAHDLSGAFRAEHRRLWDERIDRLRHVARRRVRFGAVARVVNGVLLGAVLVLLAWMLARGSTDVSETAVAAGAMLLLAQRLGALVSASSQLYECSLFLGDTQRFLAELDEPGTELAEPAPPLDVLRCDAVSFRYPAATTDALRAVDVQVRRGEMIALVGANGSGKTTLAKVLAQLYTPTAGAVTWNGTDIADLEQRSRQDQVAVIFQDYERFMFTAAENIGFGDWSRAHDRAHVERAAAQAGAAEFIEPLRHGYDTLLGPQFIGGSDLSIGQWQRVAVARAFFRDANLVILDEPSSALDPDAEAALFERLRELGEGRAVVVVSHRFSTVKHADRIYVLDEGAVIEHGSHAELVARGGTYARLFEVQARAFTGEQGGD